MTIDTSNNNAGITGMKGSTTFTSPWWLPGGHAQTLYRKFSQAPALTQVRERIELDDGDFIDVDWSAETGYHEQASDIVVFILHGLCGCSRSPYILSLQKELAAHEISSVAMNFRGCSGEMNRLAKAYHSGISEDVEEVVEKLARRWPGREYVFVGNSLGANVMLKWLGQRSGLSLGDGERATGHIKGAIAVSTPFDLAECSRAMLKGLSRFYGSYFVNKLVADMAAKLQHFQTNDHAEQTEILRALGDPQLVGNIWEFDDRFTAPLHGFADASDYYTRSSSGQYLPGITAETLLIQSANDPLIPPTALPDRAALPDNVRLELTSTGGHVGFITGRRSNWLESRIVHFIKGELSRT